MISDGSAWVWIHLPLALEPVLCGRFTLRDSPGGSSVGSFVYGRSYLARGDALPLDPVALPLQNREFVFTHLGGWPGVFLDAGPDAWGRRVIERAHGPQTALGYLLLAQGQTVGALSFSNGQSLAPGSVGTSSLATLAQVLALYSKIESGADLNADEQLLLMRQSSAGGARPKTTLEHDGRLWLAKGVSALDSVNVAPVPCVEGALLTLARACEIEVPEHFVKTIGQQPVVFVERFDRQAVAGGYARWRYASARTVFWSKPEVAQWSYQGSYNNLANQLRVWATAPQLSIRQLYRRIVFNCLVGNTDDHEQNHGVYARTADPSFTLAPAFDLTIRAESTQRRSLAMNFGQQGAKVSVENLLSDCAHFGYTAPEASALIADQWAVISAAALATIVNNGCSESLAAKSFGQMPGHRLMAEL